MTCSRPQRNVHRPGIEPGTHWSEIRRPNHCATPPSILIYNSTKMQFIHWLRYSTTPKCTIPLYRNVICDKFCFCIFCYNLELVIAYFLILTTNKFYAHLLSTMAPNNATISSTNMHKVEHSSQYFNRLIVKHWQRLKIGVILLNESKKYSKIRNRSNQNPNPFQKPKREITRCYWSQK